MLSDHKFQFLKAELFEVVNMMELSPIDIYLKMTQQELFYCHEIFFERNHALDNTSNKPSIDLIRIKISLSYTSICAPQQWFIGENTHEIKISKQLFHSVTRLAALPALLLVSPAGLSTLHPHPQPSLALAAWPKGQGRFSSAQLNAPCDKKKNAAWQRLRGLDMAGKERNINFLLLISTKEQILWHKFWFLWQLGKKKKITSLKTARFL